MTGLAKDLRYALRQLTGSPGFLFVAVATLALGIGANVAVFSLVDAVWLRPLPVPDNGRVLRVFTSNPTSEGVVARGYSSYPDFLDVRAGARTLSGVAALERRGAQLDTGSDNKLVAAAVVSDNFFDVLSPAPALGRRFTESELKEPGSRTVMLSYPFWKQQFDGDRALPGKSVTLDRQAVLVAGVLPRGFRGTVPGMVPDVWIPVATWTELVGDRARLETRSHRSFDVFARLSPRASLEAAAMDLDISGRAAGRLRPFPRRRIDPLRHQGRRCPGLRRGARAAGGGVPGGGLSARQARRAHQSDGGPAQRIVERPERPKRESRETALQRSPIALKP